MKWTCRKIELFIDDYLEEKLSVRDKFTYEAHLQACPRCREYLDRTSTLIKDAHQIGEILTTQDPARPCRVPQKVLNQVAQLPTESRFLLGVIASQDNGGKTRATGKNGEGAKEK
jgi:predicted anti-sigma-YlaC factor YlaD